MSNQELPPSETSSDRTPAFTNEDDLRSEFLLDNEENPRRVYKAHAGSITPIKILRLILGLVTLFMTWFLFLGPGKPTFGKFLDTVRDFQVDTPTPTRTPTATVPSLTPTSTTTISPIKELVFPAVTQALSEISTSTAPPTLEFPTETPTLTATIGVSGCVPALSVTLADLGKTMCVTGNVIRTEKMTNGFLITLENPKDAFYFVSYDRTWEGLDVGDCVFATGEIMQLGDAPVMVLGYQVPLEFCP